MPTWRLAKYRHNKSFSEVFDQSRYPDWAITALFYAALHLVDAVLERELGRTPDTHIRRSAWLHKAGMTRPIAGEYQRLRGLSEQARYDKESEQFSQEDVQAARGHLAAIEEQLLSRII